MLSYQISLLFFRVGEVKMCEFGHSCNRNANFLDKSDAQDVDSFVCFF